MPLNTLTKLTFDQQNQALVTFNGSASAIASVFAGESRTYVVQVVNPPVSQFTGTYSPVSMAGITLDISVSATPSGTNTVAPVAQVLGIAWDATNQWNSGVLDFSPAGVYTLIGTGASVSAFIEFRWWNGATPVFTIQFPITIKAPIDKGSAGSSPLPATSYYTSQQSDNRFVTYEVPAGVAIVFLTTDPKKKVALTVGDDLAPNWVQIILP